MSNYILIDLSYFIFYRYYALISWWKLAKPDEDLNVPIENEDFVEKFKKTFIEKIKEIPKKLKINKEKYIIYTCKDCSRNEIWRHKLVDKKITNCDYKENRVYDDTFMGGPFFKMGIQLIESMKIPLLSYNSLEADDCIAIISKELEKREKKIYIIGNDMDYLQLNSEKIKIFDLKFKDISDNKKWSGNAEKDLFCKIVMGDKSDNINGIFKKCGIKTALKYFEDKELFEKKLEEDENAKNLFEMNRKLIDFNEIPIDLKNNFLEKFQTLIN